MTTVFPSTARSKLVRRNVRERFESYNWNVIGPIDGHDIEAVSEAIEEAKKSDKPTLIDCKTVIGFGSPNRAGTSKAHGSPLGDEELAEARRLWLGIRTV